MLSESGPIGHWAIGRAGFAIGAVARPITTGDDCGDVTACWEQEQKLYLCLADGLGHGEFARAAALAAVISAKKHRLASLPAIFAHCNQELLETRGVAMGIAVVDPVVQTVTFCGVGNIRVLLWNQRPHHFSCSYGIVGAGFKNLLVETLPFLPGDTLILTSDGIMEQFVIPDQEVSAGWSAQRLAEAILEQWGIATDDAAVLVCRALIGESDNELPQ